MLRPFLLTSALLLAAAPAQAASCIVDFQTAVTETEEGKSAQTRIDTMLESRRTEVARMQTEFEQEVKDLQSRAMILSDEARAEAEQALMTKQARLQQTAMQYETELGQTYQVLLSELDQKMRSLSITIAKEKNCDMLLDAGAVVYTGPAVNDITKELVTKYNSIHK